MESCLSDMEASLFDKYLRLCSVAAAIGLSLWPALEYLSAQALQALACQRKDGRKVDAMLKAAFAGKPAPAMTVGFDSRAALGQSARPLIRPIPLSAGGSRRLPAGLFLLAQR
jgi:hypothetical protein